MNSSLGKSSVVLANLSNAQHQQKKFLYVHLLSGKYVYIYTALIMHG